MEKNSETAARTRGVFTRLRIRDLVFIALASAAMIVTCAIMPLFASIQLFGVNFLAVSLQIACFQAIILGRVRKVGASFISMTLLGLFHLAFSVWMCPVCIVAGLLGELFGALVFRGYTRSYAVGITAALMPVLTAAGSIGITFAVSGQEALQSLFLAGTAFWIPLVVSLGILGLAIVGSSFGTWAIFKLRAKGVFKDAE